MKKTNSFVKKITSLFLSLVFVLTSFAAVDFSKSAAKIAKDLGATISDVINATATFSRAGFNLQDATELGRVATLFKNVGEGISIDKASESIISVMKAFNIEASEAERIIDRINHVSNNFAIDSQGLGFALQRVASAMRAANNTLDETIALTTVANEIVQNPEMVAQGWRTVALRIRGAKTELEEAGEDTEGMVESTAKLRDLIKGISGVDIMLDENTFKSTYQIIEELGKVWSSISDVNQASLLEAIAGKRQSNIVAAALTNYERLDDVLDKSVNSFGSARKEQEKYERSVQYSIDTLKAAYQEYSGKGGDHTMTGRTDYLSDEELKLLIEECEKDPVPAAPDVTETVLERIHAAPPKRGPSRGGYALYCARVWLAVAASVAFLMFVPIMDRMPTREEYLSRTEVPDREEVLIRQGTDWYYETVNSLKQKVIMIFEKTEVTQ